MPVLRTAAGGHRVANPDLGDPVAMFLPWLDWNRAQLAAGHLPLWNPYNGSGVPHLANGQSAVFSPFSLPYYVLPLRWGPVASAFVQLVAAGGLTYGLLRHLSRSRLAALVGGLAFAFCGTNVLWLQWPLSDAACLVPGVVWGASALVTAGDPGARYRAAAGTAGAVGLGLLAGQPETTFFGLLLAGAFATARVAAARLPAKARLARLGWLAGAGALGVGVAGVELLPLTEYVHHSAAEHFRGGQILDSAHLAALHVFPLVLGSPAQRYSGEAFGWPAFVESADAYVGGNVLVLAGIAALTAVASRARPRIPLFFLGAGLAALAYGYDAGGVAALVGRLPVFDLVMVARSAVVWQVSVAVLAAFGVDLIAGVGRRGGRDRRDGRDQRDGRHVFAATVAGWWVVFTAGGVRLARALRDAEPPSDPALAGIAAITAGDHIRYVVATLGAGMVGAVVLALARRPGAARVGGAVLVCSVFLQNGVMFQDFNPTVDPGDVYPETPALRSIAALVGDEQTLWLDDAGLVPDINLRYRLRSPGSYDALVVDDYDALYRTVMRSPRIEVDGFALVIVAGPVRPRGIGSLRALGVRFVATGRPYPFDEDVPGLELVADTGDYRVFRVPGSPARYFSPARVTVTDRAGARRRAADPAFDPLRSSVVTAADGGDPPRSGPAAEAAPGEVDVLEESATSVRLRVRRDRPGWLVAMQTRYPGWRARVDGRPAPIATANAAFLGVRVPAGESVVELHFAPQSVRVGLVASLVAGTATVGLLVAGLRRRRSREGAERWNVAATGPYSGLTGTPRLSNPGRPAIAASRAARLAPDRS
jgi:hypothetical protein